MKQVHRSNINKHLVRLVEETSLERLIPKLLEKGIFSERMKEKYSLANCSSARDLKADLYLDVQRRGPEAYQKLIEALAETGHDHLVEVLNNGNARQYPVQRERNTGNESQENYNVQHIHGHTVPVCFPKYLVEENETLPEHLRELAIAHPNAVINLSTVPIDVVVRKGSERKDRNFHSCLRVYPMGSKPKGYFLMINNINFINGVHEERKGAEVDEVNLTKLFDDLGYNVISRRNKTQSEMKQIIREFAEMKEHKDVDSCVIAVLSHGHYDENSSYVLSIDSLPLSTEWIIDCFSNRNAPCLADKPKIFFFQACRGDGEDYGVKLIDRKMRIRTDGAPNVQKRTYSDILIAYATIPGYVSHRDTFRGTWFIEKVCDIFMNHACDTDIEDMLKMVDNKLRSLISDQSAMQTSCYENRGFQKFYFNPGLYDENTEETS